MIELMSESTLLARRGRSIQALLDGDPVAWSILGVVVLFMAGSAWFNYMRNRDNPEEVADDEEA